MNTDITWCTSADCPSKNCKIHIRNLPRSNERQMVSVADLSEVCRYYIGCILQEVIESESARWGSCLNGGNN